MAKTTGQPKIKRTAHEIDASGQVLGRLASEIAQLLRGKHKVNFIYRLDQGDSVVVKNASQMKTTGTKLEHKPYYRHSGYPGGLSVTKMKDLFAKDPGALLRQAVWNMLPKNKLRSQMIKRLKIIN